MRGRYRRRPEREPREHSWPEGTGPYGLWLREALRAAGIDLEHRRGRPPKVHAPTSPDAPPAVVDALIAAAGVRPFVRDPRAAPPPVPEEVAIAAFWRSQRMRWRVAGVISAHLRQASTRWVNGRSLR